jgi:hypothetical protein
MGRECLRDEAPRVSNSFVRRDGAIGRRSNVR